MNNWLRVPVSCRREANYSLLIINYFAGRLVGAGAALLGAGAAAAGVMLDTFTGVFTVNEAQMESTQITIASVQVAFSMKSVVLR